MATTALDPSEAPGVIVSDALYTLAEIQTRLKLGQHALRQARRRGLKGRKIGRRRFYTGREVLDYVESCPTE